MRLEMVMRVNLGPLHPKKDFPMPTMRQVVQEQDVTQSSCDRKPNTCNQRFTTKGWTETAIMLCKLNKSL